MGIESVIRRVDGLGLRQTLDPPDVYPPAPRGRGDRGRPGRTGGRINQAEDVFRVQDPFDVESPRRDTVSQGIRWSATAC